MTRIALDTPSRRLIAHEPILLGLLLAGGAGFYSLATWGWNAPPAGKKSDAPVMPEADLAAPETAPAFGSPAMPARNMPEPAASDRGTLRPLAEASVKPAPSPTERQAARRAPRTVRVVLPDSLPMAAAAAPPAQQAATAPATPFQPYRNFVPLVRLELDHGGHGALTAVRFAIETSAAANGIPAALIEQAHPAAPPASPQLSLQNPGPLHHPVPTGATVRDLAAVGTTPGTENLPTPAKSMPGLADRSDPLDAAIGMEPSAALRMPVDEVVPPALPDSGIEQLVPLGDAGLSEIKPISWHELSVPLRAGAGGTGNLPLRVAAGGEVSVRLGDLLALFAGDIEPAELARLTTSSAARTQLGLAALRSHGIQLDFDAPSNTVLIAAQSA